MSRPLSRAAIASALTLLLSSDSALASPPPPARAEPGPESSLVAAMHRNFLAIRDVHRALLSGNLPRARDRAALLERVSAEGALARDVRVARIRSTAGRLAHARSQRAARVLLASLATQCAGCHRDRVDASRFIWPAEPSDDGSAEARMARHEWAAETLWMGLVAPSGDRWREGMEALSADPLLPEAMSDDRERYAEIDRLGRRLAAGAGRARLLQRDSERAAAFADLLGVCSGCHALARR